MRLLSMVVLLILLAGCATTYHRVGFSGGYSETRLGEDIFQISFEGNGYTREERVVDFSLLRSAELAIENEFRYFIIVDSKADSDVTAVTTSGNVIRKPRGTNTVRYFKEKPEINGLVFDAEFVVKSIKEKYGITK